MRVVLCDPHALFTEALQSLFEQRGYEAHVTSSPQAAAQVVAAGGVDIVLMDLWFPGLDGREFGSVGCVATVIAADPQVRVIVLTALTDSTILEAALAEGAVAVADKAQPLAELFLVVERVRAGEAVLSGQLMRAAMGRAHSSEQMLANFLTAREREVLARLTRGESTRQIAQDMGVAYSTARTHIQSVLDKLGVHSRLEAAAFAARHQLAWPVPNAVETRRES
ncbi:MAG: two-component system, NarL family, nitrate/nitrite response regulator NarL [Actinomycetota bacterium]|jgi:two-component system nitrate/nitrite response regulator NarL|nr:two-component system, NarL family, nitrate/nitrite response regulator NarL [Actinomycetota bacterium]